MQFQFRHHRTGDSGGRRQDSFVGKMVATIFFLSFFGMGLFFEVFIIREVVAVVNRRSWPVVSCRILESSVRQESNSQNPYKFAVKFEYQVEGQVCQSSRYQFKESGFRDYARAQALAGAYPVGSQAACFVNPANPSEAILKQDSLGMACFILIPTVFVLVGAGGIYGIWFYKPKPKDEKEKLPEAKGKIKKNQWGLLLFGFIFFAAGSGFSYVILVRPLLGIIHARSWVETPCVIISGQILSHDSDDGTTYSVDILYEYVYADKAYRSNRYDFMGGSSSGYQGKRAAVDKYLKLKNTVCYVNPESPNDAVLIRNLTWIYAIGLFPLIFVAVGLAIMMGAIIGMKRRMVKDSGRDWMPKTASNSSRQSGFLRHYRADEDKTILKPQKMPVAMLVMSLVFCGFWNGVISVFIMQVIHGFKSGHPDWCLALFMTPFVLVGMGTVIWVIYQFLALFNPRFEMTIQPAALYPGSSGQLQWTVRSQVRRIRKLVIKLTAIEETFTPEGKNNNICRQVFYEKELVSTELLPEIKTGQIRFTIPQRTMHSFESRHNKIIWAMDVKADIPYWPDVKQKYKFFVSPKPVI